MKLSPAQADLILAMQRGVRVHYMDYSRGHDAYWFRADTMKHCTKQVQALIRRGLVAHTKLTYAGIEWKRPAPKEGA